MNDITVVRRFSPPPPVNELVGFGRQAVAWLKDKGYEEIAVEEPSEIILDGSVTLVASVTAKVK